LIQNWNGKAGDDARTKLIFVTMPEDGVIDLGEEFITGLGMADGRWYFEAYGRGQGESAHVMTLGAVDVVKQQRVEIAKVDDARGGNWFPNADFSLVAFVEYSEQSLLLDPPARVMIFDTKTGAHVDVPAPVSAYGVAFANDNRALFLGSNEAGTIQRVDLADQKITQLAKGHRGIQALYLTPNGKTLLVVTRGAKVARYAVDPWKKLAPLTIASFLPGQKIYSWDWTTFAPDRKHVMFSKNRTEDGVDFVDMDHPGVSLFKMLD
jgi:sugar lactone lactonase YvrE